MLSIGENKRAQALISSQGKLLSLFYFGEKVKKKWQRKFYVLHLVFDFNINRNLNVTFSSHYFSDLSWPSYSHPFMNYIEPVAN